MWQDTPFIHLTKILFPGLSLDVNSTNIVIAVLDIVLRKCFKLLHNTENTLRPAIDEVILNAT